MGKFDPSAAERWTNCPGSVRLSEGIPRSPSGDAANHGTAIHYLCEKVLSVGGDVESIERFLGKSIYVAGYDCFFQEPKTFDYCAKISEKDVRAASVYVEFVSNLRANGYEVQLEERVSTLGMNGKIDCKAYKDGHLIIADYKNGFFSVSAGTPENPNPQLGIYGMGAFAKAEHPGLYQNISLVIVQPNSSGRPIESVDVSKDDFTAFAKRIASGIKAAEDVNAPIRMGEWCKWCPAMAVCPEQNKNVLAIPQNTQVSADTMTKEGLEKALLIADSASKWIDAVKAIAYQRLKDGAPDAPSTFKLVSGRKTKSWSVEEPRVIRELLDLGLDEDKIFNKKIRTPTQVMKALGKNKEAITALYNIKSSVTMVPASDSRPAADLGPDSMFTPAITED